MVANNKYLYNRKADRGINLIAIGINDYIGVMGSIQTKQQYISSPGLTIKLAITAHY